MERVGMSLLVTISIGLGIGVMVELLLPGHRLSELVLAVFLGIAGALLARVLGVWAGWFGTEDPSSFIASVFGAVIVLLLYGVFFRCGRKRHG